MDAPLLPHPARRQTFPGAAPNRGNARRILARGDGTRCGTGRRCRHGPRGTEFLGLGWQRRAAAPDLPPSASSPPLPTANGSPVAVRHGFSTTRDNIRENF
jgi:hypothetical protein